MQLQAWGQIRDGTGGLSRQSQGETDAIARSGGLIRNATASDDLTLNSDKVVQNVHLGGLPFIRRERNTLSHR